MKNKIKTTNFGLGKENKANEKLPEMATENTEQASAEPLNESAAAAEVEAEAMAESATAAEAVTEVEAESVPLEQDNAAEISQNIEPEAAGAQVVEPDIEEEIALTPEQEAVKAESAATFAAALAKSMPDLDLAAESTEQSGAETAAKADEKSTKAKPASQREKQLIVKEKEKKQGFKYFVRDVLSVVVSAVLIAVLLRTFVVDSRLVPTESMYPTITGNDRVILVKFAYYFDEPQRGDVVVFASPDEMPDDSDLLKRVIGLPGDTIEVREGLVYINGIPLNESYIAEAPLYEYGPTEVPENSYFMLGDNRNRSNDSHIWTDPFIDEDDIKGEVVLRYWPFDRFGLIK